MNEADKTRNHAIKQIRTKLNQIINRQAANTIELSAYRYYTVTKILTNISAVNCCSI